MWETITSWFVTLYNWFRPQTKAINSVIKSMEQRIESMDAEFKAAMVRRDSEMLRSTERIASLEASEQRCRTELGKATGQLIVLRAKVKGLMAERKERDRIKAIKEDDEFQERTRRQVTELVREEERLTKMEGLDEDTTR